MGSRIKIELNKEKGVLLKSIFITTIDTCSRHKLRIFSISARWQFHTINISAQVCVMVWKLRREFLDGACLAARQCHSVLVVRVTMSQSRTCHLVSSALLCSRAAVLLVSLLQCVTVTVSQWDFVTVRLCDIVSMSQCDGVVLSRGRTDFVLLVVSCNASRLYVGHWFSVA